MADLLQRDDKASQWKLTAVQYVIVAVLLVLVAGLWRLQILDSTNYRVLAEQNRVRKVPVLAPRGKIVDRENRLIVDNYVSTSCFLLREQSQTIDADLPLIANGLHMSVEQIQSALRRFRGQAKYEPIPLKQDITPDEVEFIESHRNELPELETVQEPRRLYPTNGFAAHLIGYVGEVSEDMLDNPKYEFYQPGDVVGKAGVEQSYDEILRGTDGSRDVVVNSHGKEIGQLGSEPSVPGKTLRLTMDLDIQKAAEEALGDRSGAMIAWDPRTGEVLALVSHPAFDPNEFAVKIHRDEWNKLLNDPHKPLMDKAIQAQLAPGSTFKVVMSVAGLEEGVAQKMHVFCAGGAEFYGHLFKCDKHHGMVDIEHALPWSCDTFFYTLAQRLGIDTIAKYAHELGLGYKTGIDLPDEVSGTVPSEEWKLKTFHEKWYAGETISVGIGQGAVAATPIQMLRALSGVASGGILKRPHVVFHDEQPPNIDELFPGSGDRTIPLSSDNWEIITDGMAGALDPSMGGTAGASHLDGIDFAGKTGTAQVISHEGASHTNAKAHNLQPNSWFVGMTPRRNPEIAVVVLWENGDWGSNSAKLAAQVITAYVEKQRRLSNNMREAAVPAPVPQTTTTATPPATKPAQPKPTSSDKKQAPATKDTAALEEEMGGVWSIGDVDDGHMHGAKFQLSELTQPATSGRHKRPGGGR
jgi:penicillin-binding protein 2